MRRTRPLLSDPMTHRPAGPVGNRMKFQRPRLTSPDITSTQMAVLGIIVLGIVIVVCGLVGTVHNYHAEWSAATVGFRQRAVQQQANRWASTVPDRWRNYTVARVNELQQWLGLNDPSSIVRLHVAAAALSSRGSHLGAADGSDDDAGGVAVFADVDVVVREGAAAEPFYPVFSVGEGKRLCSSRPHPPSVVFTKLFLGDAGLLEASNLDNRALVTLQFILERYLPEVFADMCATSSPDGSESACEGRESRRRWLELYPRRVDLLQLEAQRGNPGGQNNVKGSEGTTDSSSSNNSKQSTPATLFGGILFGDRHSTTEMGLCYGSAAVAGSLAAFHAEDSATVGRIVKVLKGRVPSKQLWAAFTVGSTSDQSEVDDGALSSAMGFEINYALDIVGRRGVWLDNEFCLVPGVDLMSHDSRSGGHVVKHATAASTSAGSPHSFVLTTGVARQAQKEGGEGGRSSQAPQLGTVAINRYSHLDGTRMGFTFQSLFIEHNEVDEKLVNVIRVPYTIPRPFADSPTFSTACNDSSTFYLRPSNGAASRHLLTCFLLPFIHGEEKRAVIAAEMLKGSIKANETDRGGGAGGGGGTLDDAEVVTSFHKVQAYASLSSHLQWVLQGYPEQCTIKQHSSPLLLQQRNLIVRFNSLVRSALLRGVEHYDGLSKM